MNDHLISRWIHIRKREAFTIIEVLATLTLVAIVLPAVIEGISLCQATAGHAKDQTEAAWLAQSKLAELVASGDLRSSLAEDFGPDWPEYRWEAEVNDWEDPRLTQLDVSVIWTRRGRQRSMTLTTLVYERTPSE